MADPDVGHSSPEEDHDFDPTAEMLIHDYDDEQTMDEEEAMSNDDSVGNELDDLQKESEIPVEELLAMYGYGKDSSFGKKSKAPCSSSTGTSDTSPATSQQPPHESQSNAMEVVSTSDTVESHEKPNENIENGETSVDKLDVNVASSSTSMTVADVQFNTVDFLSSDLADGGSDDDEDYDPEQDQEDWKKSVPVGGDHQACVPDSPTGVDENVPDMDKEDRILWSPADLSEEDVATYLAEVHKHNRSKSQSLSGAMLTGSITRDDEQALYLLLQCENNFEEALRRHKLQAVPPTDPMSLWTEEECRNFETGLRLYGKDFFLNQQNKVKSRSVREIVQFYYLWKKTERHDAFAARTRLEKKKYALHPGITDYMDRFIYEFENPLVETSTGVCTGSSNTSVHKNFSNIGIDMRDGEACPLSSCSATSIDYQMPPVMNQDQCCEGIMDCCNVSTGVVSCSYDELATGAHTFSQTNLISSSSHLVSNDISSLSPSFSASVCYDYATASSAIHLPPGCGNPYNLCHSHQFPQTDLHNSCYAAQVESSFLPVASQVFGAPICNNSPALCFPQTTGFYHAVDTIVSDPSFTCVSKNSVDCSVGMVDDDVESLISSSNMNSATEPQELTITDINMIFGNVDRTGVGSIALNGRTDVVHGGDMNMQNIVSSDSTTSGFLPVSMQRLCSDDGMEPTLENISASIQELVGPDAGLSPENLFSVLETGSCCNMPSTSTSVTNSVIEVINESIMASCIPENSSVLSVGASSSDVGAGFFQLGETQNVRESHVHPSPSDNINNNMSHSLDMSGTLPQQLSIGSTSSVDESNKPPIVEFRSKDCSDAAVTS